MPRKINQLREPMKAEFSPGPWLRLIDPETGEVLVERPLPYLWVGIALQRVDFAGATARTGPDR